jgi:hypothetical protein
VLLISGLLVFALVCGVAAWFVIREAARMSVEPPPPLFDPDEAFDWVVEHVPDDVAASLTPGDVRRILDFQIEFLTQLGMTQRSSEPLLPGDIVVGDAETIEYILARAHETGEAYVPEQVQAVVDTQLDYLQAIGAIGGEAEDDGS